MRALSRPTHATGTPGGICTIERIASRPPAARQAARERHADHGYVGVRSDRARKRGGDARAGDHHAQAACARGLRVLGDDIGFAVGRHHADLVLDPALLELARRLHHLVHVALGAHHDAHPRTVHVELLELRLRLGLGARVRNQRDRRARILAPVPSRRPTLLAGLAGRISPATRLPVSVVHHSEAMKSSTGIAASVS